MIGRFMWLRCIHFGQIRQTLEQKIQKYEKEKQFNSAYEYKLVIMLILNDKKHVFQWLIKIIVLFNQVQNYKNYKYFLFKDKCRTEINFVQSYQAFSIEQDFIIFHQQNQQKYQNYYKCLKLANRILFYNMYLAALLSCIKNSSIIFIKIIFRQKISQHIFSEKFNNISKEMKDLLYSIFIQMHQHLYMKQQAMMSSMQINQMNPYSMNMYYGGLGSNYPNLQDQSNPLYTDQIKKYMESSKSYPYNMINMGLNPLSGPNSIPNPMINPQIGSNLNGTLPPHSYMNNFSSNPTSPSFNPNNLNGLGSSTGIPPAVYSQMMRGLTPKPSISNNFMYGMNPYSNPPSINSGVPSLYGNPYSGNYPPGIMNGYPQPPQSYSHFMPPIDKAEMLMRHPPHDINSVNLVQNLQKRYSSLNKTNQLSQKVDRQKSLPKQPKNVLPPQVSQLKTNYPTTNSLLTPTNQLKEKDNGLQFLPKKLPSKQTKRLNEPNQQLKNCACRGYFQYQLTFICGQCKNKFHNKCLNVTNTSQQKKSELQSTQQLKCAHCKMRTMDPLNKVEKVVGQYYLMNLYEKNFQAMINFKLYQAFCRDKNSKYELEVRCIRSGDHMKNLQITWPDECLIKINNDKIVDIPALQTNSSLKKRKDYSVFITQNIFKPSIYTNSEAIYILERMKFSLELKTLTQQQLNTKKIRNQFTFALGIYLVQKLNTDQLYAKILSEQKVEDKDFLKNLMKSTENQVEIDKITIRLIDPFSWDLIKTPVRGSKCIHAQCFDLKTFISLMYSAKNRTWRCPLCSKDSRKFIIDHYQTQLLKKAQQINPTPKQVAIYKQGKITFKVQKDSDQQDQQGISSTKTKKIAKQLKNKEETSSNIKK